MKLLVMISPKGQDAELGVEIDRVMKAHYWNAIDGFDYTYAKDVENEDLNDLKSGIADDVEAAFQEAEWSKVSYLYIIGGTQHTGKSK